MKGKDDAISCLGILISTGFHEIISNFTISLDLSWISYWALRIGSSIFMKSRSNKKTTLEIKDLSLSVIFSFCFPI